MRLSVKTGKTDCTLPCNYGASEKMLKLLLDHGAKLNQKDSQGRTPLVRAREKKHKKAIAFFEAEGATA